MQLSAQSRELQQQQAVVVETDVNGRATGPLSSSPRTHALERRQQQQQSISRSQQQKQQHEVQQSQLQMSREHGQPQQEPQHQGGPPSLPRIEHESLQSRALWRWQRQRRVQRVDNCKRT
mmetsp:Transcript_7804/g.23086  ORF Transcript_7804/g.23086 Transcript_7804/m.23086 type:complete len:120 (+) Transcript_7804:181-540(+)